MEAEGGGRRIVCEVHRYIEGENERGRWKEEVGRKDWGEKEWMRDGPSYLQNFQDRQDFQLGQDLHYHH